MLKRLLLPFALVLLVPLSVAAQDTATKTYVEGRDYDLISPAIRTANPDKIEVVEFFWYGCGHCYTFEPMIAQWKKTLPEDVDFHGSPAMWNAPMELHARAYYTAQVLGVLDTMHTALFQAMNVERKRLASKGEIAAVFTANGVSAEDFDRAFDSFGVDAQVRQASARMRSARVTGTPALMVNGKYHISTRKSGSQAAMIDTANYLIEKERAAKAS
ncbi:MAG: thiol:disulfide interchange protein DsbA/DsbL [Halioglobus sp.]|nr:thiol:disulfide interchange protein DsbA/DsbL [Halioglobus sp.]